MKWKAVRKGSVTTLTRGEYEKSIRHCSEALRHPARGETRVLCNKSQGHRGKHRNGRQEWKS